MGRTWRKPEVTLKDCSSLKKHKIPNLKMNLSVSWFMSCPGTFKLLPLAEILFTDNFPNWCTTYIKIFSIDNLGVLLNSVFQSVSFSFFDRTITHPCPDIQKLILLICWSESDIDVILFLWSKFIKFLFDFFFYPFFSPKRNSMKRF